MLLSQSFPRPSWLNALLFVILSGLLLVVNKALVLSWPQPNCILLLQLLASAAAAWAGASSAGQGAVTALTSARAQEAAPLALCHLLMAYSAMQALALANVDVLAAVQAATPAAIAAAEQLFLNSSQRQQPRALPLGIALLLTAAALSVQFPARADVIAWLGLWLLSATFYLAYSSWHAKALRLPPLARVYHESALSGGLCLLLVLLLDARALPAWLAQLSGGTVLLLAASGAMAFGACYCAWSLREAAATSAAAYTALSVLSALLAVGVNVLIWDWHGPTAATLLLLLALALAGLPQRSGRGHAGSSHSSGSSSDTVSEGGKNKGHVAGTDPLSCCWGVVACAAAVGGLLWLLASAGSVAQTSTNPTVSHSRQQLEQELEVVTSELHQLRDQAVKWEQAVLHNAQQQLGLAGQTASAAALGPMPGKGATSSSTGSSNGLPVQGRLKYDPAAAASNSSSSSAAATAAALPSLSPVAAVAGTQVGAAEAPDPDYLAKLRKAAETPITVVVMTGIFWTIDARKTANCSVDGVPLKCKFYMDQSEEHVSKADALYYHVPSFSGTPIKKRFPNQLRLAMSLESATYYISLDAPTFMCQFDAEMSYRHCAQVTNWYSLESFDELFKFPVVPFEQKEHAIVYINSNCGAASGRTAIMQHLLALNNSKVPVHSYGNCDRNRNWPAGNPNKRQVFSKYKFCVTMENSLAHDYVTEKLWDGLAAGCVPIYLGSPSALTMVPDASSVIMYDPQGKGNASTVEQLDALMHEIGSSKERYEKMLAWKQKKVEEQPSPLFKHLWSVRDTTGECFLCQFLARHRVNPKPKYTTCLFNETWMASAGQKLEPQPGCE